MGKIISKNAKISINVKIGDGTVVISGSSINIGSKIGSHCLINSSSSIDHDNIFEDFSSTGSWSCNWWECFNWKSLSFRNRLDN